ncbi:MAG: FAD-dependent oxidoreductase [Actinobacteria bacterium]|nr:FAD-dependent oxidoreductase [Actinomycetota bacterium]
MNISERFPKEKQEFLQYPTVTVIGAGITGCAIARELSKYKLRVTVIEKEADVGWGTSKANSGHIHPGHASKKGSLLLSMGRRGHVLFVKNASELSIPMRKISSNLNAFNTEHIKKIEELLQQGRQYNVPGLSIITNEGGRLKKMEPNLNEDVIAALHCSNLYVISPYEAVTAIYENSNDNGVLFLLNHKVEDIHFDSDEKKFLIRTSSFKDELYFKKAETIFSGAHKNIIAGKNHKSGKFENKNEKSIKTYNNFRSVNDYIIKSDYIINAAGVYADDIAKMAGDDSFSITAIKGQYFLLDSDVKNLVNMLNIRVSDPENEESKGMYVGLTPHGNFILGSNYEVTEKDDTGTSAQSLDTIKEKLSRMINNIPFNKVITTFAGVRAYASTGDFVLGPIKANKSFINAAGIQSPGLTCAFYIAEVIAQHLKECGAKLINNPAYNGQRKSPVVLDRQDFLANKELYNMNDKFAEIVCRCEKVSEAEIIDAIRNGATTLDSVKFRTRAGMGRCQGGYCTLRVAKILSRELGVSFESITKSGQDSFIAGSKMP